MKRITYYMGFALCFLFFTNIYAQNKEIVEGMQQAPDGYILKADIPNTGIYHKGAKASLLYENGPFYNIPGSPNISRLETSSLGMNTLGFGSQQNLAYSVADDFTLTDDADITEINLYCYQTGSSTSSTITAVYLQVWDGMPGSGGSVIWGDAVTNVLDTSTWSDTYRDTESSPGDTSRPIMVNNVLTPGLSVIAGTTYWLDWSFEGTLGSGPWQPPIAILGQATTGDALQSLDGRVTWNPVQDNGAQQGFPFQLIGDNNGNPPVISCPTAIAVDNDSGVCGAIVNFADAVAIDVEDGPIPTLLTSSIASGDEFPVGVNIVTFSATDTDGNTSTCQFTVTVNDNEDPIAVCQDITVELDAGGTASILPTDIDAGSTDNCIAYVTVSPNTFSCSDVGDNAVTLTITDNSGNEDTCTATVTVEDNQAPVVICKGSGGAGSILEEFEAATIPAGWSTDILVGSHDWSFGSGDLVNPVYGFPAFATNAAIFDDDAAGSGQTNMARLTSPVYSLLGADSATLSFDYSIQVLGTEVLSAEVFDGANWVEIFSIDVDTPPTSFPAMDVLPYVNSDFQVRFTYDDVDGGWNWGAGVDNFALNYNIPPTDPLEVVLDADGTVTVPGADLLFSVDDNCGWAIGSETMCDQSNPSGGNNDGYFYTSPSNGYTPANDLTVEADIDFTLNQIVVPLLTEGGETITSVDLHYYEDNAGEPGAEIGNQLGFTPSAQTVVETGVYGFYDVSEVILNVTPFTFASQSGSATTYWIGMQATATSGITAWEYNANTANGAYTFTYDGTSWGSGAPNDCVYTFSGICGGGSEYTFDCSNLGENSVDVTVVDAGGNEVTCTATVIVTDETAPVVVCGSLLYDSFTESISPAATIDTTSSDITITSTITVADDFTIFDVNVPMDITHSWIGDIVMSLTSPAGTTVMLHNGTGGGDQDILMTYDDEGDAPASPLAAFDGENSMGDWVLTINDTWPGLDGGMLNTWGLEIEYSYPNPDTDITIELDANGEYTVMPEDITTSMEDPCGIDVVLLDLDGYADTTLTCADIGLNIQATLFVNDASGNFASCQTTIHVIDAMKPTLTCPDASYETEPSNNDGVYIVRDYFGDALATYSDNCTDNSTLVVTQDPAPGTAWGINGSGNPGPYVVTFTVTDESGNVATCTLDVTVTNGIGVTENTLLDNALNMYPNPATNLVKLVNTSDIALESAMIYDINGKLITELDLNNMGTETQFDVSHFANGIYMVKIIGKNASTVKRLIKE